MENFLSFVTDQMKSINMPVDIFLSKSDINRSRFYRFAKEPSKFSANELEKISNALQLDAEQKQVLFSFQTDKPGTQDIIQSIIFLKPIVPAGLDFGTFEFFDAQSQSASIVTANQFADAIFREMPITDDKNEFYISIFNSTSEIITSRLILLLSSVQNKILCPEKSVFKIIHYVNKDDYDQSMPERLRLFKTALPFLGFFTDYQIEPTDMTGNPWGMTNYAVLKYKVLDQKDYKFMIFSFDTYGIGHIYSFTDTLLYLFMQKKELPTFQSLANPMLSTEIMLSASEKTSRILISYDFCFDCILPENWDGVFERLCNAKQDEKDKSKMLNHARQILDPNGIYKIFSAEDVIKKGIDGLRKRYQTNELSGQQNIISADGLEQFANSMQTLPSELFEQHFTLEEVLNQLTSVYERLGKKSQSSQQAYYVLKKGYQFPMYSFIIYRGEFLFVTMSGNPNTLYQQSLYRDSKISTSIYDFITNELLSEKQRSMTDSPIMTDDEAGQFLEALIHSISN